MTGVACGGAASPLLDVVSSRDATGGTTLRPLDGAYVDSEDGSYTDGGAHGDGLSEDDGVATCDGCGMGHDSGIDDGQGSLVDSGGTADSSHDDAQTHPDGSGPGGEAGAADASSGGETGSGGADGGGSGSDAALACGVPGACVLQVPIETLQSTGNGLTVIACPGGPSDDASTPQCLLEIDLGNAALTFGGSTVTGTVPMRVQDLPWQVSFAGSQFTVQTALGDANGNGCNGSEPPPVAFGPMSVQLTLAEGDAGSTPTSPVLGCDPVSVTNSSVSVTSGEVTACGCPLEGAFCQNVALALSNYISAMLAHVLAASVDHRSCLQ